MLREKEVRGSLSCIGGALRLVKQWKECCVMSTLARVSLWGLSCSGRLVAQTHAHHASSPQMLSTGTDTADIAFQMQIVTAHRLSCDA